jgi:hypothetical protein
MADVSLATFHLFDWHGPLCRRSGSGLPLATVDVESGAAGRIIEISRQLRNLHWLGAEISFGMDAELAESLADREELLSLDVEEIRASGGRFRQRRLWRGTQSTSARLDEAIGELRPQLDEVVADLFIGSSRPSAAI